MRRLFFIVICFSALSAIAAPPPVPSAGIIERQIEKEYETEPLQIEKPSPEIQIDIPKEKLQIPPGIRVRIKKIELEGNRSISAKKLEPLFKNKLKKKLAIGDIYQICQEIEAYYVKQGYFLARAYPPPQDVKNGVLIIRVMEGKLGNVEVIGNTFYSTAFIRRYFAKLQHRALRYNDFLRALILLNENSDLAAGAIFEKGQNIGEADVIVRVEDKRPVHLYLNANNYGRWLTTNYRAGGRLDAGSLLIYGDKLSIAEVIGFPVKALYFTDIVYRVPIGADGAFLEMAYLTSRFHIQQMSALHLKGSSNVATLKFTQAACRRRNLACDLFSYFDYKQIKNYTLSDLTSFDKLRMLTFGALVDHNVPGSGRDYLTMRAAFGLPGFLGGLNKNSAGCSRPGAKGDYFKLNVDYDRLQKLTYDCFLFLHGSGQWSPSKLTVPEQIYIGGVDTIRGFPLAVAMGDSGYYVNMELRLPPFGLCDKPFFRTQKKWKDVLQFALFMDQGGVSMQSAHNTFLVGTGFGVIINGPWSLSLTADAAFPLNHRSRSNSAFYYLKLTGQPF